MIIMHLPRYIQEIVEQDLIPNCSVTKNKKVFHGIDRVEAQSSKLKGSSSPLSAFS